MKNKTITTRFSIVICLISLDEELNNSELIEEELNYENKKHNILELLKQVEDLKNENDLMNFNKTTLNKFYEIMYKNLTKEEGKNNNYNQLLFKTLTDIHYLNKEYNEEQLNDKITFNKMLNILEERKKIILYNLTHKYEEQYKGKDLNEYLEEYSMLYEKFMNTEKYDFEKHYKYEKRCEEELIKQYKQNDKIDYNDFYNIIESIN